MIGVCQCVCVCICFICRLFFIAYLSRIRLRDTSMWSGVRSNSQIAQLNIIWWWPIILRYVLWSLYFLRVWWREVMITQNTWMFNYHSSKIMPHSQFSHHNPQNLPHRIPKWNRYSFNFQWFFFCIFFFTIKKRSWHAATINRCARVHRRQAHYGCCVLIIILLLVIIFIILSR